MTIKLRPDQKNAPVPEPAALYLIMREVLMREKGIDKNREHLWVASLAKDMTLLNLELISIGNTSAAPVEPSAIFSIALQKDSKYIVLIHNHPSGHVKPSEADDEITKRMYAIGGLVNCQLFDHMIISEKGYYSYRESDRLATFVGVINAFDPRGQKELERLREELVLRNKAIQQYEKELKAHKTRLKNIKKAAPKKKIAKSTKKLK
jgi:DNA repair protein RadC